MGDEPKTSADNLDIVDPRTGVRITTFDRGGTAGLFISDPQGHMVALCYQPGVGPYIEFRKSNAESLPVAINHEGIQLSRPVRDDPHRFISWDDLFEAVAAHVKPRPR